MPHTLHLATYRCRRKEVEGEHTAHAQPVRKKISTIRHQSHNTTLDMRVQRQIRVLQSEGADQAKDDAEGHGNGEGEEEDADAVEEGGEVDVFAVELGEGSAQTC